MSDDLTIAATSVARETISEIAKRIKELEVSAARHRRGAWLLAWSIPALALMASILTLADQKRLTVLVGAVAAFLGAVNAIVDWRGTAEKAMGRRNAWKEFQGPFVGGLTGLSTTRTMVGARQSVRAMSSRFWIKTMVRLRSCARMISRHSRAGRTTVIRNRSWLLEIGN
jgi:hypothetical protein